MQPLEDALDAIAERPGSPASCAWIAPETRLAKAYGLADRGHEIANTIDTRFAIAAGRRA